MSEREAAWDERIAATLPGWWPKASRLLLATMLMGLLTGCSSVPPPATLPPASPSADASPAAASASDGQSVDPVTSSLLPRYGLVPRGPTTPMNVRIGKLDELPWALYLEASRAIGLDFAGLGGKDAQLRTTPVVGNLGPQDECAGCRGAKVHVMVAEGRMVGAWLSDDATVPGIYALSEAGQVVP